MRPRARRLPGMLAGSLALLMAAPALGYSQNAADLMRRALDAQAQRLQGIENVTIVQEVMGMVTSIYMEKREMGGAPVLFPVSVSMGGMTNPIPEDVAQSDWASPFQEAWVERVRLVGEETLNGMRVHVLAIDDFSGLELPGMPAASENPGNLEPTSIRFWMDDEDYLTHKVSMDMEGTGPDGSPTSVHMDLFMEDYREVDGYLHPFVTRTVTQGIMDVADLDPAEVRAQLQELRAQMENMPEAQRAMMEGMMNAQIERLESMLEGQGGMEMNINVKEIRVNSGGSLDALD